MKTPIILLLVLIIILVMDKLSDRYAKLNHDEAFETEHSDNRNVESWNFSMEAVSWSGHFRMGERKLSFELSKRVPNGQDQPYITVNMGN
jgi:hypothetical protein